MSNSFAVAKVTGVHISTGAGPTTLGGTDDLRSDKRCGCSSNLSDPTPKPECHPERNDVSTAPQRECHPERNDVERSETEWSRGTLRFETLSDSLSRRIQ